MLANIVTSFHFLDVLCSTGINSVCIFAIDFLLLSDFIIGILQKHEWELEYENYSSSLAADIYLQNSLCFP